MNENKLENILFAFHRKFVDEMRKEAEKRGMNPTQFEVMGIVFHEGNPTMKDIADKLGITPPSTTAIVENLCEKGLLERIFDENDRRITRIVLTPKSLKEFSKNKNMRLTVIKNVFSKIDKKDIDDLERIINKLVKD